MKKLSLIAIICLFFAPLVYAKELHHKNHPAKKIHSAQIKPEASAIQAKNSAPPSNSEGKEVDNFDITSDMMITLAPEEEPKKSADETPPKPDLAKQQPETIPAKSLNTIIRTEMSEDEETSINIGNGMNLKTAVQKEENDELNATINISYPQITGPHLSEKAKQFNHAMQEMVTHETQQFKNYVKADLPHMKTLLSENPQSNLRNDFQVDYDVEVIHPNHNTILSVRLNTEGMQIGRAHPYHNHRAINYDLNAGKSLALENMFKSNSNYLKVISNHARKQLLAKLPDKWMIEQGTKSAQNYQAWSLQNDSLLITFNEYQVAPYASGPQEVEIPYAELKQIIAPNSVMAGCAASSKNCG